MSEKLILFDLPRAGTNTSWALNPLKSRLVLNYKKIPYETEWTNFNEITPKLKAFGVPPHENYAKQWTVPAIKFPDGSVTMESMRIAEKLEALRPEPSLRLDTGVPQKVQDAVYAMLPNIRAMFIPAVRNVIDEPTKEWFEADRKAMMGMTLDEFERTKGGEAGWKAAAPSIQELANFLKENRVDDGPFVLGSQLSYADFIIAALVEFLLQVDRKQYDNFVGVDDIFKTVHDGCKSFF